MRIGWYLCNNCKRGIIYKVDRSKGIKVYVDADLREAGVRLIQKMLTTYYHELASFFVMQTVP